MALGTRRTPERDSPFLSGVAMVKTTPYEGVLTTGGGVVTLTAAQLLGGLLTPDTDDAQSLTLPTAALLNAAIPGVEVGTTFDVDVINYGDTTLTLVVGTGITAKSLSGVAAVLTVVANASKRLKLRCTGVIAQGSTADSWDLYAFGSVAAATA